ncbi:hypothetical protein [Amycolatopsis albispora]|uniref:hypothetical protein n=1 Tax=Amycolatopsis albispora TaxID=1804986 RepID=UPI0013B36FB1|nr:hypothetical protein [Amycolatopsis albispora]
MPERMTLDDEFLPALEFEVYDVRLDVEHKQWVESIDKAAVTSVWLGHRASDDRRAILVGTIPKRADQAEVGLGLNAPGRPIGRLMDIVEPWTTPESRSVVGRKVIAHLESKTAQVSTWPRTSWMVSGVRVEAAVMHFGGAWLALADSLTNSTIVSIGVDISPDDLEFSTTRGATYGLDFKAPITVGTINKLPTVGMPKPNQPHPDLLDFLAP